MEDACCCGTASRGRARPPPSAPSATNGEPGRTLHFVLDPEAFFGSPEYLMHVVADEDLWDPRALSTSRWKAARGRGRRRADPGRRPSRRRRFDEQVAQPDRRDPRTRPPGVAVDHDQRADAAASTRPSSGPAVAWRTCSSDRSAGPRRKPGSTGGRSYRPANSPSPSSTAPAATLIRSPPTVIRTAIVVTSEPTRFGNVSYEEHHLRGRSSAG